MPANRRQLYQYKGDRCAHCGITVEEMIEKYGDFTRLFELNHVDPSRKHRNYKNLIRRVVSTEQIDEVDKCVLLCKLCHGAVHQQNIDATVSVTVKAGGRQFTQTFKGQIIHNRKEKKATFLTDERVLLQPYHVFVGAEEPRLLFGAELRNGELASLMRRIDEIKSLVIKSWADIPMLEMISKGKKGFNLRQDISFPILDFELNKDKKHPTILWVRKGIGLTREGEVFHTGMLTCSGKMAKK